MTRSRHVFVLEVVSIVDKLIVAKSIFVLLFKQPTKYANKEK